MSVSSSHRSYSGLNRPAYRVAQTDRQGYRYAQTVPGPIVSDGKGVFGWLFGR